MARGPKGGDGTPTLVWLRRDLRVQDNPALHEAAKQGGPIVPVFVLDDAADKEWALGGASRWWLHHSLTHLTDAFAALGSPLVLRRGDAVEQLSDIARRTGAQHLHVGQAAEPALRGAVDAVEGALRTQGVAVHRHRSVLLFDPEQIKTKTGGSYSVFTPFLNACLAKGVDAHPLAAPKRLLPGPNLHSETVDALLPLPGGKASTEPDWAEGLRDTWTPGEPAAATRLKHFVDDLADDYEDTRNIPGVDGTSRLSAHLHWGELSARQAWAASIRAGDGAGPRRFRSELIWREFCSHLLWHHPDLGDTPLRRDFERLRWRRDPKALRAWQRGRTGVPIVDAGMRQLWQLGWQHNRVRMITASFLIKHLLIDWREGERWFWDTLVDGDLASNAANWQWVAGCGADASPFFRVFNPVLQGRKFDPDGAYVRHFVPEIAALPDRYLHAPWEAPAKVMQQAGLTLGRDYPQPIVELGKGRQRALDAFRAVSGKAAAQ